MKLRKNDKIKVITGKDKGKEGTILKVLKLKAKVLVEGVNIVKKHVKPGVLSKEGGIISIEKPIDVSNVMIMCEKCNAPVRIGYKIEGGKKVRVCKKCEGELK